MEVLRAWREPDNQASASSPSKFSRPHTAQAAGSECSQFSPASKAARPSSSTPTRRPASPGRRAAVVDRHVCPVPAWAFGSSSPSQQQQQQLVRSSLNGRPASSAGHVGRSSTRALVFSPQKRTTQAAPAQQLGIFGGQMNMGARGFNPNTSASTESITIKDSAQSLAQGAGLKHVKVGLNGQAGSRPSSAAWKACDDRAPYVSPYKQTSSPCTPGSPATTRPMSSPGKAAKGISAVSAVRQYLSTVQPPATAGMSPQQPANAKAREDRWAALTGRSPVAKRPATADVVSHKPAVAAEEAAPPATTAANNQMTLQQLLRVRQPGEETRPSSAWVSPSPGPTATAVVAPEAPTTSDSVPGYTVEHTIGEGGFCQVRQGVHHLSGRKVAIKVIDKQRLKEVNDRRRIAREVSVLKGLSHPTIIKLLEVSETPARIYLVMEQASSGSLLDYVRKRKRLSELESCLFLQQIVHGLAYCHSREVVHRDVKLENILLDAHNNIKLIDFGLCGLTSPGKKLRVHCGSPSYAAPEIVARKAYEGPPVDVWSLGVVLFAMICGHLPFHAANDKKELCNKIMKGVYNTPDYVSVDARDLLGRMLTVDPEKRITFEQVLTHRWVRGAPLWQPPASSAYAVDIDPYSGDIFTDADVLQRLQEVGHAPGNTIRYLANADCNAVTAAYFLLCEAKRDNVLLSAKSDYLQQQSTAGTAAAEAQRRPSTAGMAGAQRTSVRSVTTVSQQARSQTPGPALMSAWAAESAPAAKRMAVPGQSEAAQPQHTAAGQPAQQQQTFTAQQVAAAMRSSGVAASSRPTTAPEVAGQPMWHFEGHRAAGGARQDVVMHDVDYAEQHQPQHAERAQQQGGDTAMHECSTPPRRAVPAAVAALKPPTNRDDSARSLYRPALFASPPPVPAYA